MLAIRTSSLKLAFNSRFQLTFPDWELPKQDDAVILGPSGSGKTTLLHVLGGLLTPTSGDVEINGQAINHLKSTELERFRRTHVGIVFQQPHLIRSLSVIENLQLARYLGHQPQDDAWILEIIEQLDLVAIKDRNVKQISQGQAQRVAIARAIINKPTVLFGDEPTASLDDENCARVISLLKQEARLCDATLIIATHDQRVKKEFKHQLKLDKIA